MPVQGNFWILVLVGLLIANLALLFYVKLDFDKKVGGLSQEVKDVKESLLYVKQDFDKRIIELLQEINYIKANEIKFDKNTSGEKLPPYLRLPKKAIAYSIAIKVGK